MAIGKWEGFRPAELLMSLLALLLIFWLVDFGKILRIIYGTNLVLLFFALCAYYSTMLLMTWRIRFILSNLHEKISCLDSYKANMGGVLASDFTPARAGYFITPLLLQKSSDVPLEKGMITIVSPQIAEFFLKASGAAAAIILIAYSSPLLSGNSLFLWAGVGVMLLFCVAMGGALFVPGFVSLVRKFCFLPFVGQLADFLELTQTHGAKVRGIYPVIFAVSVAILLIKGVEWYLFSQSLGIQVDSALPALLIFTLLQPLITVFQFAPFPTVAGLGLAEGSAVAAMGMLGVPAEMAVAYALLIRGGTMLVNSQGVFSLVPFLLGKKKP